MSSVIQKQIEIYVIFNKLTTVNTVQGRFEGEIDIVASWFDTIHGVYDSERHWNPQLVCENLIDKDAKIRTRVEVKASADSENQYVRIIQYQKITGIFAEWLHVKEFPFDIQKIGIQLTSLHPLSHIALLGKQEYCYLSQKAIRENDSWYMNQYVSIEYNTYQEHTPYLQTQQYPEIKFNALIARKSQFYITNLIFPLFLVTSTIFISFTNDSKAISSRLGACATTLLTAINFRFVIHNHLPNVPYSTYLDIYSMVSIVFITLVFGWHGYSRRKISHLTYAQLDSYVLIIAAGIFILGHIIFIVFAWILPKRRQVKFLQIVPEKNEQFKALQSPIVLDNLIGYERSVEKMVTE